MRQFIRVIVETPRVWYSSGSVHSLMLDFFYMLTINAHDLDFCICIVVFHFCSQNHGQASFCLALAGHAANGLPETAGPLRKDTTEIFSIRITSLINSWQTEPTGAGITGKMMIYLQTSQLQLTLNPATKGKQKNKKIFDDFVFFYDNQHNLWPIM